MFQPGFQQSDNYFGGGGTQFGAAGGFVPTQGNEPTQGLKKFAQQTIRAVTIKQIREATRNSNDESLILDGEEVNNITLVARIVSMRENETNLDIQVEDSTGRWDVKLYVDADDYSSENKKRQCQPGHYVRIHGHLRVMEDKYPLVAFSVRQIIDFNEVTYHFLSCIYQHAHFTRGAGSRNNAAAPSSAQKPGGFNAGNVGAPAAGNSGFGHQGGSNEPPCVNDVREAYLSTPAAISIQQVVNGFNGKYSPQQIRDAVERLSNDGALYQVTDDVYKHCQHN